MKFQNKVVYNAISELFTNLFKDRCKRMLMLVICLTIFVTACLGSIQITKSRFDDESINISNMSLTLSSLYAIISGDAKLYDEELEKRIDIIHSTDSEEVIVPSLSKYPSPIFLREISTNENYDKNRTMAMYYGKKKIRLSVDNK